MSGPKTGAMLVLCAAVGVMMAATVRITSLMPTPGDGMAENPDGDGMVKLEYIEAVPEFNGLPGIRAHVHLYGFMPNTTYGIMVDCVTGFVDRFNATTTNDAGNANCTLLFSAIGPPDPNSAILVYRETLPGEPDPQYTEGEERAIGVPQ